MPSEYTMHQVGILVGCRDSLSDMLDAVHSVDGYISEESKVRVLAARMILRLELQKLIDELTGN